jgi:L-threonylcarbamoyladenylate synthase
MKSIHTRVYKGSVANLRRLARALQRGELVGVPTETVYGLAGNALDPEACREIFRAKGRPTADPLIVHIHDWSQLEQLAEPNEAAKRLAKAFWPGPLTMILPKKEIVDDIVTSGLPSVAIRMPGHRLFRRLLKLCRLPLAAPSANPFGYVSPTTAAHVKAGLDGKIRHILDGGAARIGLESSIVDLRDPKKPRILRPGAITREQMEKILGCRVLTKKAGARKKSGAQVAPGLLKRHYSPHTPVVLHEKIANSPWEAEPGNEAWLLLSQPKGETPKNVFWLDERGALDCAARRLFGVLRSLDTAGYVRIHAELAPGTGLADAINDRLRRAAAKG